MAEFQKVCKQWRRMCDKHTCSRNKDTFTGLPVCPVVVEHEGYPCDEDPIDWTEKATKQFEEIVMSWAAENPEQVYPTWYAWLANMGIVPIELPPDKAIMVTDIGLLKKIPADIAQKLGIEPKDR